MYIFLKRSEYYSNSWLLIYRIKCIFCCFLLYTYKFYYLFCWKFCLLIIDILIWIFISEFYGICFCMLKCFSYFQYLVIRIIGTCVFLEFVLIPQTWAKLFIMSSHPCFPITLDSLDILIRYLVRTLFVSTDGFAYPLYKRYHIGLKMVTDKPENMYVYLCTWKSYLKSKLYWLYLYMSVVPTTM